MKKLLLILLVIPFLGIAQEGDWHPMPSDQVSYYKYANKHINTLKVDSIIQTDTGQLYYNLRNIVRIGVDDENGYYDPFSSWLGKTALIENGNAHFYETLSFSPMTIKYLKTDSEPWLFYTEEDGSYFEAHIAGLDYIEILDGIYDSVKYIDLQGYSQNQMVLADLLYEQAVVLSKNYGLIKTVSFTEDFYSNLNYREIIGLEFEGETYGWKNHFDEYITNYRIGDEIHYTSSNTDYIEFITAKNQTDDYVEYTYRRCDDGGDNISYSRKIFLGYYPRQTVLGIDDPNKQGFYRFFLEDDEWEGFHQHHFQFMFIYKEYEYDGNFSWQFTPYGTNGLMEPMYACNEMNNSIIKHHDSQQWRIDYFDNGDFIYGTPYDFGCDVGLAETLNIDLQIIPNPSNGIFSLTNNLPVKANKITIYNTQGELMWKQKIQDDKVSLDLSFLPVGLYIMKMDLGSNQTITRRLSIIK